MDPAAQSDPVMRHNLRLGAASGPLSRRRESDGRDQEFIGARTRSHGCKYHGHEQGQGKTMATDYDAPRKTDEDAGEESIEELKTRRHDKNSGKVDEDEAEAAESFELPGADLSHEELAVRVLPRQADEFTCSSCFLVHHRSQLATDKNGQLICRDCAA